jgi:hypothetical protein
MSQVVPTEKSLPEPVIMAMSQFCATIDGAFGSRS